MLFKPVFSGTKVERAEALDQDAADLLYLQPNDCGFGIAAVNRNLEEGLITVRQLEELAHASNEWPLFTRYLCDACGFHGLDIAKDSDRDHKRKPRFLGYDAGGRMIFEVMAGWTAAFECDVDGARWIAKAHVRTMPRK